MRNLHVGTAFAGSTFPQNPDVAQENLVSDGKREWSISEMARDFGVTLRTLRFYEAKGLIAPQRFGVTRYYSGKDRARLQMILNAKKMGFTLSETAEMLGRPTEAEPAELSLSAGTVANQIAHLEAQQRSIEAALTSLRQRQQVFQDTAA